MLAVLPGRALTFTTGQISGYGNLVVLDHGFGLFSLYGHLASIAVEDGDQVDAGQLLGAVGRTFGTRHDPGRMFAEKGAHLHFELLSKWPPDDKDLNRLDPVPRLAELGIIAEVGKPLAIVAGSLAARTAARIAEFNGLPGVPTVRAPVRLRPSLPGSGGLISEMKAGKVPISLMKSEGKTGDGALIVLLALGFMAKKDR